MKIVDLPTFLALPPGAIYAKYKPCVFGELAIKDDSFPSINPSASPPRPSTTTPRLMTGSTSTISSSRCLRPATSMRCSHD